MTATQEGSSFEGWAIVELMGHRKLGGYAKEETVFGAAFLRLDVPDETGNGAIATQFYNPTAIYCLTPCSEEVARRFSVRHQPQPVARWELPALKTAETEPSVDEDKNYGFGDSYEDGDEYP